MKKFLFASLVFFASLASFGAATVTLTNGGGCEYSVISLLPTGAVTVACSGPATSPTPTPTPAPPATPPGNYPGDGMWLYQNRQMRTGILQAGDEREARFTVPSGYSGTAEIGISGQNLKVFVDGIEYADGPVPSPPGPHVLKVRAVGSAEGTITLYHSP